MRKLELGRTLIKIFLCFIFYEYLIELYEYLIGLIDNPMQGNVLKAILGIFFLTASGMALFVFEHIDNEEK